MVRLNLPKRKEMNQENMSNLISNLAELVGGDDVIIGELFPRVFNDLSATNQEKYIHELRRKIKVLQEGV